MVGYWAPKENCCSGFLLHYGLDCGGHGMLLSFQRYLQNSISHPFVMEILGLSARDDQIDCVERVSSLCCMLRFYIVCSFTSVVLQLFYQCIQFVIDFFVFHLKLHLKHFSPPCTPVLKYPQCIKYFYA